MHDPPRNQTELIGRAGVLDRLAAIFEPGGPRVTYIHGLGGIGKTSVLRALASRADRPVVWFDALHLPGDLSEVVRQANTNLVVIDELDQAPATATAIRRYVVPHLNKGSRLVLASRGAPGPRWAADLGLAHFLPVAIEALSDDSARELLRSWDVSEDRMPALLQICAGHPLMLTLAAQLSDLSGLTATDLDPAPELVVAMVEALGARPGGEPLREALLVCAIARRTTEALLRRALGLADARELFDALAAQSWCLLDRDGLYPHQLVRSAQRSEAKWRDRPTYDRLFRAVADETIAQIRKVGSPALDDTLFLLADNTFYRRIAAHRHGIRPGPATETTDLELIGQFFDPFYGPAHSARIRRLTKQGLARQFLLHDDDGAPTEMISVLDDRVLLQEHDTGDPVLDAARSSVRQLQLREGSRVLFSLGACHHKLGTMNPLSNCRILATATRMALEFPGLTALGSLVTPADTWRQIVVRNPAITVFEEVEEGGHHFIAQLQDLRVVDLAGWLQMQLFPPPAHDLDDVEILDRDEFTHAVRELLRATSTREPEAIETTRFARTPVARRIISASTLRPGVAILTLVTEVASSIPEARSRAALEQTYIQGSPKQFAAAMDLGLSFATYRRALAHGVSVVTEELWQREMAVLRE